MAAFQAKSQEQHAKALGQYAPNDRLFASKNLADSNLYKLFLGLGGELKRVDEIFESVWVGVSLLETRDLQYIAAWEGAVGLPDEIFQETTSLTLEERRGQILLKLRSLNVLTEQDFIDLGALLGVSIMIEHPVAEVFPPYTPPFIPSGGVKSARFTLMFRGEGLNSANYPPYNVPFLPSSPNSQIRDLFEVLKAANTKHIYLNS